MEFRRWISEVDHGAGAVVGARRDDPAALRSGLEAAASGLFRRLDAGGHGSGWRPLRLTKAVLRWFDRCDAAGLAALGRPVGEAAREWPVLRGAALDAFVAHSLFGGAVDDPAKVLDDALRARGEVATAEAVAAVLDATRRDDLAGLAAAATELRVDAGWVPRVEVTLGAELADGALRLPGRADVLLGGPGTDRAAVVIEVKSAPTAYPQSHIAELQHYALLCTLRHGEPPAALALWYPDGTTLALHVPGAATAAAARVEAVLQRIGAAADEGSVAHRPGPQCGWCPHAPRCAPALRRPPSDERIPGGAFDDDRADEEAW